MHSPSYASPRPTSTSYASPRQTILKESFSSNLNTPPHQSIYSPITTFTDDTTEFISHFKGREKSYEYVNKRIRANHDVKPHELPNIGRSPYSYSKYERSFDYSPGIGSPNSRHLSSAEVRLRSPKSPIVSLSSMTSNAFNQPHPRSSNNEYNRSHSTLINYNDSIGVSPSQKRAERYSTLIDTVQENSRVPRLRNQNNLSNIREQSNLPSEYNPKNYSDAQENDANKINFNMPTPNSRINAKPSIQTKQTTNEKDSDTDQSIDSIVGIKKTKEWLESAFTNVDEDIDAFINTEFGKSKSNAGQGTELEESSKSSQGQDKKKENNELRDPSPPSNLPSTPHKSPISIGANQSSAIAQSSFRKDVSERAQDSIAAIRYNSSIGDSAIQDPSHSSNQYRSHVTETFGESNLLDTTTTRNRKGPCLIPGYETPYNIDRHTTRCSKAVLSTHLFLCGKDKISNSYPSRMEFFKHGYESFWNRETTIEERRLVVRWMRDQHFQLDKEGAKKLYSIITRAPRAEHSFNVYMLVDSEPEAIKIELALQQGLCVATWHPDSLARRLEKSSTNKVLLNVKIAPGEPYIWLTNELIQQADDRHIYGINHVDTHRQFLFWIGKKQLRVKQVKDQCVCAFQQADRKSEFRVTIPVAYAELL